MLWKTCNDGFKVIGGNMAHYPKMAVARAFISPGP
jgi:hypothetical protein